MKRLLIIFTLFISAFSALASDPILEQISELDGVTTVYLSKGMLGSFSQKGNSMIGEMDISSITGKLNYIEIYNCDDLDSIKKIRTLVSAYTKNKYEVMMRIKDESSLVKFLHKGSGNSSHLITIVDNKDNFTIISMSGNISISEIQKLTNK